MTSDRNDHVSTTPRLSVVLPVLNEESDIGHLLTELLGQKPIPGGYELLVADGGSTDRTREIVRDAAHGEVPVRLLDNPRRWSSAGRNVGAGAARGEFVLFLDGHCALPRRDYLLRVVEIFDETGADCLARPQLLNRLREGSWAVAISDARHSWFGHDAGSDIYGCAPGETDPRSAGAAYRRQHWLSLGGYDERFDACEDVEFNHRVDMAGLCSWAHPDLTVYYRPRSRVGALYRQMFRYGRGRAHLMAKHPRMWPRPLVGLSGAVLLVLLLAGAGEARAAGLLLASGVAAWLTVALVESLRASRSPSRVGRTLVAFGAIYAGLLLGFWRGLPEGLRYRGRPEPPSKGREL